MGVIRRVHPLVWQNHCLRTVACLLLFLINWSVLGSAFFSMSYAWMPVTAIAWPHIARMIAEWAEDGKLQETRNMYCDAILVVSTCFVTANAFYIATVLTILIANALFVGYIQLLGRCMVVALITACTLWLVTGRPELVVLGRTTEALVSLILLLYFSAMGIMGNKMSSRLVRLHKQIQQLSFHDALTGAFNRGYLDQRLPEEVERCYRLNCPLSVIFADIDHFKQVNDTHGHATGDALLRQFVQVAKGRIRTGVDWLARFGGEEFVLVLPNATSDTALKVAERLRCDIEQDTFTVGDLALSVTCSFGVTSIYPDLDRVEVGTILEQADLALYKAKAGGRNRTEIQLYHAHMNAEFG